MHVRMVRLQVPPDQLDDFIQHWHAELLPYAKSHQGWKSARLLVDRDAGKVVIVGHWATEADARASGHGSTHFQRQHASTASLLGAPPEVEMEYYEVAGEAWEDQAVGG